MIHNRLKFTSLLLAPRGWRVRGLDWRLSQPGFDPSYGKLICLATLMSSDRTKQICLWMNIYIYIYIRIYVCVCVCVCVVRVSIYICICCHPRTVSLYHNFSVWLDTWDAWSWDRNPPNFSFVRLSIIPLSPHLHLYLTGYQNAQFVRRALHYIYMRACVRVCVCTYMRVYILCVSLYMYMCVFMYICP